MKTTTFAALAFGLSLAAAPAFAADDGQGRDRDRDNNNQPTAGQTQGQNSQGDRDRDRGKGGDAKMHRDRTPPSAFHKSDWNDNNNNNNNNRGDNDRNRNDRSNDKNTNNNDNNRWNDNNRRDGNHRNDTNFRNNNTHSAFDRAQYRRNFKSPKRFRIGVYHAPRGYYYRRWHYGERLPIAFFGRDYWLLDFVAFGLFAPPPGCVWVRYGDDALLIDTETGEIIQVRYDVFYS